MFEFRLPDLGEGIHEGELLKWHIKQGDSIHEDDPLCDMETDKAAVTIPCPRTGIVARLIGTPGDTIAVGDVLVQIDETISKTPVVTRVTAAPAIRRLAREMGIDIQTVGGTGPGKRVTREDLEQLGTAPVPVASDKSALDAAPEPDTLNTGSGIPFLEIASLPDYEVKGIVEKVSIRSLRKKIATKTTSSMILVPHVAHMEECDVTDIEAMRKIFNRDHSDMGKLTLISFVIKAISSLLKIYPEFNASVDPHKMEIIYKKFYHVGFAADTPRGLIVPVIKNTDQKSVVNIADKLRYLSKKGRDSSITLPELSNGTFSVTNVGAIGGTGVIPIINYPETAILGMGRVQEKPMVKGDEIVIRKILPVTLCFDHRVADGVQAAHFVKDLKQMLEDSLMFMTLI